MKIVACVKYVPDTAIKVKIGADGKAVDLADAAFVVNPYDEFAVEEALQLKEKLGGEVIVLGAGSEKAQAGLRTCLAMGADSAILIKDDGLDSADPCPGNKKAVFPICYKFKARAPAPPSSWPNSDSSLELTWFSAYSLATLIAFLIA